MTAPASGGLPPDRLVPKGSMMAWLMGRFPRLKLKPEEVLQITCLDWLRARAPKDWFILHPANEALRGAVTWFTLQAMGLVPGVADLVVMRPNEAFPGSLLVIFIEFKDLQAERSPDQESFGRWCAIHGYRYETVRTVDSFKRHMIDFGLQEGNDGGAARHVRTSDVHGGRQQGDPPSEAAGSRAPGGVQGVVGKVPAQDRQAEGGEGVFERAQEPEGYD